MRANANVVIAGSRVVLVPYRREHVPQYHEWMKRPELQEATASEPLSLEEEYAMQASWRHDDDKLTFILLDPALPDTPGAGGQGGGMAGDVNLFFNDADDPACAEIEIMVAEASCRRRGVASQALLLMMHYAARELGTRRFVAKIGEDNGPSLALFRKLGYAEVGRSAVFREVTLAANLSPAAPAPAAAATASAVSQAETGAPGSEAGGSGSSTTPAVVMSMQWLEEYVVKNSTRRAYDGGSGDSIDDCGGEDQAAVAPQQ